MTRARLCAALVAIVAATGVHRAQSPAGVGQGSRPAVAAAAEFVNVAKAAGLDVTAINGASADQLRNASQLFGKLPLIV